MDSPSISGGGPNRAGRWLLRLLGGFELGLVSGGEKLRSLGKRERALLAYLAVSSDGREQRKKLATLLWCDSDDETSADNLRTCLWRLRKALGDSEHRLVASEGEEIVLDLTRFEVDARTFRRLANQSGRAELEAAGHLYAADFLDGLTIDSEEFETWRRVESMRYRDEAIDALTRLMMLLGESGETRNAIEIGNRVLRLEPLQDAVVRRLMQLYGESGRRGAAVQLYRAHDDALRAELNARPEPETRDIFAELAENGGHQPGPSGEDARQPLAQRVTRPVDGPPEIPLPLIYSKAKQKTLRLALGLAACITGVVALLLFLQLPQMDGGPAGQMSRPESARGPRSPEAASTSIAVLPLINMSGDPAQDVFADGMSEEITTALAKLPGLRVVGRSSAFRFKEEGRDLRAISRALNAPYLLDGSVRRANDRVRVTAQLVHAEDETTLWSESYDREFTDIFEIQTEIARAIAIALRVPLGLRQGDTPDASRTVDVSTYEDYLRARAVLRGGGAAQGLEQVMDVRKLLEEIVQRYPEFAAAWAALASVYDRIPLYSTAVRTGSADELRRLSSQYAAKAEEAAQEAIRLDPNLAEGYMSLAFIDVSRRDMALAFDHITKALSLDPTNPDVLAAYRNILLEVGRVNEALDIQQRVVALEPFVPRFKTNLAMNLWLAGQDDAAIEIFRGSRASVRLAMIYAARGDRAEAADTLMSIPPGQFPQGTVETAARLLRAGAPSAVPLDNLPQLGVLGFIYLHIGEPSRVVEFYEASIESGYLGIGWLWHESYAPVRKTERFKTLVQRARLPEFWRARGWPAYCRPIGTDDFTCS